MLCANSFTKEFFVISNNAKYETNRKIEGTKGVLSIFLGEGNSQGYSNMEINFGLIPFSNNLPYGYKAWISLNRMSCNIHLRLNIGSVYQSIPFMYMILIC